MGEEKMSKIICAKFVFGKKKTLIIKVNVSLIMLRAWISQLVNNIQKHDREIYCI